MSDVSALPTEINGLPAALGTVASTVTAAGTVIKAVSDLLPDETRSIVVEVVNLTSRSLVKGGDSFAHGGFGPTLPAAAIPAFRSDVFSVESGGLATGVEGWVTYTGEGAADFTIHVDDPFLGSNSQSVGSNTDDVLSILGDISGGNHAHARFTVLDRNSPFPALQGGWRSCPKCQGLHFAGLGDPGACPAGGRHEQTGSFAYQVMYDSRPSDHVQSGWRSCPKCRGLYFADLPDAGACAGGGKHESTESLAYTVEFDSPAADRVQHDWRSCFKCNSLYFGPFNGVCSAGGAHDPQRSFNYAVRF